MFSFVYVAITPHDEWKLVKQDKNTAAATGLAGALIGFALALGSVVSNSIHLLDFVLWGVIALTAQLMAFALVRFVFMPELVQRIKDNEVSAGVILECHLHCGGCIKRRLLNLLGVVYEKEPNDQPTPHAQNFRGVCLKTLGAVYDGIVCRLRIQ